MRVRARRGRQRAPGVPALCAGSHQRCDRHQRVAARVLSTARKLSKGATCGTDRVACGGIRTKDGEVRCRIAAPSGHNQCDGKPGLVETACAAQTRCADVIDWTAGTCLDPRHAGTVRRRRARASHDQGFGRHARARRARSTRRLVSDDAGRGPVDTACGGVVDAPLDLSGGPYPLLMFSHGSCGYALQSKFLTPLIASYGFIVAAPPHPGNTLAEFPTCGIRRGPGRVGAGAPDDIIFVTDQMLAANADNTSPFFGAIDPDRIGMSGHSFGGLTTYLVAHSRRALQDRRPDGAGGAGQPTLTVPSLTMIGADRLRGEQRRRSRTAYAGSSAPKMKVEIEHAGHFAFSDGCFPTADCNPPTTLTQDEAHALVLRWVVPVPAALSGRRHERSSRCSTRRCRACRCVHGSR